LEFLSRRSGTDQKHFMDSVRVSAQERVIELELGRTHEMHWYRPEVNFLKPHLHAAD